LLSPDSIQEGEEENISVVAQGMPLRIGYVERIAPGLTNRYFQMHCRVCHHFFFLSFGFCNIKKSMVSNGPFFFLICYSKKNLACQKTETLTCAVSELVILGKLYH
jgi:hypothetical protein